MAKKNPHAVALGRKGGSVTSRAKAKAARENGKKGGRPKSAKAAAAARWGQKETVREDR